MNIGHVIPIVQAGRLRPAQGVTPAAPLSFHRPPPPRPRSIGNRRVFLWLLVQVSGMSASFLCSGPGPGTERSRTGRPGAAGIVSAVSVAQKQLWQMLRQHLPMALVQSQLPRPHPLSPCRGNPDSSGKKARLPGVRPQGPGPPGQTQRAGFQCKRETGMCEHTCLLPGTSGPGSGRAMVGEPFP